MSTFIPQFNRNNNICKYCTSEAICLQCAECDQYFCNKQLSSTSHMVLHFIKDLHNQLSIPGIGPLKCFSCAQQNFFTLGTSENIEELKYGDNIDLSILICRDCHEISQINKKFRSLVNNRSIHKVLCPTEGPMPKNCMQTLQTTKYDSLQEAIEIEQIPIKSSLEFYQTNFTNMVILEALSELNLKEKMHRPNVFVTQKPGKVQFVCPVDKAMICIGDEIRLYRDTLDIKQIVDSQIMYSKSNNKRNTGAEIYDILKNDKKKERTSFFANPAYTYTAIGVISRIDKHVEAELINESGVFSDRLSIQFVWNASNFTRMIHAIDRIDRCNNSMQKKLLGDSFSTIDDINEDLEDIKVQLPQNKMYKKLNLNHSQIVAIKSSLKNQLTLIQGPPGTGKSLCVSIISYNFDIKGKVLICAPSNVAIDNLCRKILQTLPQTQRQKFKVVRVLSRCRELIESSLDDAVLRDITLHEIAKERTWSKDSDLQQQARKSKIIKNASIVICTCITSGKALITAQKIDYVIIDEAVQATEPTILIPLLQAKKQVVLVGDHQQLGPVITNSRLLRSKYQRSLFERLIFTGIQPKLLSVQYRMNSKLCEWPSDEFYGGAVVTHLSVNTRSHGVINNKEIRSTFFWCAMETEQCSMSGTSFLNTKERDMAITLIKFLAKKGVKHKDIGVITPYEGQRLLIDTTLKREGMKEIEVASVDAFQGREKQFIIFSAVRSNSKGTIGFLNDKRRLNVALTRAKNGLYIIGNPFTLMQNKTWLSLLSFYQRENNVLSGELENLRLMDLLIKDETCVSRELGELCLEEKFNFDLPL